MFCFKGYARSVPSLLIQLHTAYHRKTYTIATMATDKKKILYIKIACVQVLLTHCGTTYSIITDPRRPLNFALHPNTSRIQECSIHLSLQQPRCTLSASCRGGARLTTNKERTLASLSLCLRLSARTKTGVRAAEAGGRRLGRPSIERVCALGEPVASFSRLERRERIVVKVHEEGGERERGGSG